MQMNHRPLLDTKGGFFCARMFYLVLMLTCRTTLRRTDYSGKTSGTAGIFFVVMQLADTF